MRSSTRRFALLLGLTLALPFLPLGAPSPLLSPAASAGRWTHQVSGGGQDRYPGDPSPSTYTLTFNAQQDAEGNTFGTYTWTDPSGTFTSSGEVKYLLVIGNRAYVEALVTQSDSAALPVGRYIEFGVEDNGEGEGAQPDRQSFIYQSLGPWNLANFRTFIENSYGFPVEWVNGNVQVR